VSSIKAGNIVEQVASLEIQVNVNQLEQSNQMKIFPRNYGCVEPIIVCVCVVAETYI